MDGRWRHILVIGSLIFSACSGGAQTPATSPSPPATRLIYAAQDDGTVHVYDIDGAHRLVRTLRLFPCCGDIRGAAAAAPTHRFYVMYNRHNEGHVASIDVLTDHVLWDKVLHTPGVDRGSLTPDGHTLYLPSWEGDPSSPYELVVDATTGTETARIPLPPKSHDTLVSLDGKRVYMETKSAGSGIYIASTATNQVVGTISGYCCGSTLGPFSVNASNTRIVNDVYGYYGFQLADVAGGRVLASVPFTGSTGTTGHGIAWTPDEREVWVNDGGNPLVHVFDMTSMPPRQTHLVTVSNESPHWITFSIDGRFAYVSGRKSAPDPVDVIDTRTYTRIGALGPSQDLLEVDFSNGAVSAVGNQFGVGRVVH